MSLAAIFLFLPFATFLITAYFDVKENGWYKYDDFCSGFELIERTIKFSYQTKFSWLLQVIIILHLNAIIGLRFFDEFLKSILLPDWLAETLYILIPLVLILFILRETKKYLSK